MEGNRQRKGEQDQAAHLTVRVRPALDAHLSPSGRGRRCRGPSLSNKGRPGRAHAKKCKPRAERGREREKREESQSPLLLTAEAEGGVEAGCGADSQAS